MENPRHWRLRAHRYRLEGSTCPACGWHTFPSRPVCPHCAVQVARVACLRLPAFPAATGQAVIEANIRFRIMVRSTG
jgi:predicted amidophosphoribosyltransferase